LPGAGAAELGAVIPWQTSARWNCGSTPPLPFFEAREALLEEAFTPLGHYLSTGVETRCDFGVVKALSGHEHDLCSYNISIRQHIYMIVILELVLV
jgi:hypothetical protein